MSRLRNLLSAALLGAMVACTGSPHDLPAVNPFGVAIPCGQLACEPLGACDASTGTCRCGDGAWFDGMGCAATESCASGGAGDCAPACPVPTGPVLPVVAAGETLVFSAGALPVDVAVTDDLEVTEPPAWTSGGTVELEAWTGATVRVFARVATEACARGPWLNAVYRVHDRYPGPPGDADTDAVAAADGAITGWATTVIEAVVGPEVDAPFSDPSRALGPAESNAFDIYSLGRGGSITLGFDTPLRDGDGADLAVFENGFGDDFLEVAFVEVSSDGSTFVRFDGASLTPTAVESYGLLDTGLLGQLAGKYRQGWGTPFDLATLRQREEVRSGALDLDAVSMVRIVDVVGDGSTHDRFDRPIFDPYPTIESAGFDLDAVAVLGGPP